ncbi:MAG: DUF167 domain-containing protein [Thermoguttaceae bacterium]
MMYFDRFHVNCNEKPSDARTGANEQQYWTPHPDGIIVRIRVHAGAGKNEIRGVHDGNLKISVTQAPEKGKANKAICDLIAKEFSLRPSQVEILTGATSSQKTVLLRNIDAATWMQ